MTGLKIENGRLFKTNDALSADKEYQIVLLSQSEFKASDLFRITLPKGKNTGVEIRPDYILISISVPDKLKTDTFI